MHFYSPSHTQHFYCPGDSKCALTIRESPCVDKLSEVMYKPILTYKLLLMALVSHFSLDQTDTINLYSTAHCLWDLWTQQTPANCRCLWALVPSGLFGSQLGTHHFIFERLKYQFMPLSSLERHGVIFMGCDLKKVMMQM